MFRTDHNSAAGHIILKNLDAPERSDVVSKVSLPPQFHKPNSPSLIEELAIGCITEFPLAYMHLVCVGIV